MYKHGIYISEVPTSIVPAVRVDSAIPVFFVTAPVHLARDPYAVTNKPRLLYRYSEAAEAFGFSLRPDIWGAYTACQAIYAMFALYAVAPMVMVNVLDPNIHKAAVSGEQVVLERYAGVIEDDGVLIDTVRVDGDYVEGVHYTLAFNRDGFVVINAVKGVDGGLAENEAVTVSYDRLAPELVDIYDVIGGYNALTGQTEGLELVNEVYSLFRVVPGQIVAPGFSSDPTVAAIMETKARNINGHFRCVAINDIPTMPDGLPLQYTGAPAWKNDNGYTSERQYNCYPMVRNGDLVFHYSTQMAALIAHTDAENGSVPYNSPSNKSLKANGLCFADGTEMVLNVEQANYLNGQGIATAINFAKGWTAWGNRTGAYPGNTDAKDAFLPIRRMFDWIGNTIVLTYWSKIDYPVTRRHIDTIVDSVNMWFNGLASREYILGGRIEFLQDDNPISDIIDGIARFRVKVAPPPPMEQAEFILEYDVNYLQALFAVS